MSPASPTENAGPQTRIFRVAPRRSLILSLVLTAISVAVFAYHYGPMLSAGTISQYDEYFTLERSSGFARHDNWLTVYSANQPSFRKPPVQYWITAWTMSTLDDLEFALRLPSFLFGLGVLIATAILAYIICPSNPFVMPAAVILLGSSERFWNLSISALLDAGATFFGIAAIIATIAALRDSRWWYLTSLIIVVGALQKAPTGLIFTGAILGLLYRRGGDQVPSYQQVRSDKHFRNACIMTAVLIACWPVVQIAQHGLQSAKVAVLDEMVDRFAPVSGKVGILQIEWADWLLGSEWSLWVPAMIAAALLPFLFRTFESSVPPALCAGFFLMMLLASGSVYSRYVMLILPLLAVSLACLLAWATPRAPLAVLVAIAIAFIAGRPFSDAQALMLLDSSQTRYASLFANFKQAVTGRETILFCRWKKVGDVFPGAFSYYASRGQPVNPVGKPESMARREHVKKNLKPPYRGLCNTFEFEELSKWLIDPKVIEQSEGYVHWTAAGTKPYKK